MARRTWKITVILYTSLVPGVEEGQLVDGLKLSSDISGRIAGGWWIPDHGL